MQPLLSQSDKYMTHKHVQLATGDLYGIPVRLRNFTDRLQVPYTDLHTLIRDTQPVANPMERYLIKYGYWYTFS